jgi:hypothetical protein
MSYYKWNTIKDFNAWHDLVKTGLGLPKYGNNDATGEIDETAQMTDNYTTAFIEADGVYALVETDIAQTYTEGLGNISDIPASLKMVVNYDSHKL